MAEANSSNDQHWVLEALDRFEGPLTLYAARLLHDAEGARDVVQDTFLRLCRQSRAKVEPYLAEWLFTVCRNRALDVLRKEGRMAQLQEDHLRDVPSSRPTPAEDLEQRDEAAHVLQHLETLPEHQKEVIRLRFQNGFSYREISRITGHSVTNVGYLMHAGMKSLRRQLLAQRPTEAHS